MKKLLSSAVAIASVIGVCALPTQVSAGADSSSGDILGIAGSDTTTFVMDALSSAHNTNSRYNPDRDRAVNIPPLVAANPSVEAGEQALTTAALAANKAWLAAARSTWPGGIVLPADNDCKVNMVFGGYGSRDLNTDADTGDGAIGTPDTWEGATIATADLSNPLDGDATDIGETWYLGLVPPNGSSSGRSAVEGGSQNGLVYNGASGTCIDIARSSSRSTSAKLEGWAFALDAIDWTYFAGNTHGVATSGLTKAQLGNIYTCYAGTGTNTVLNGGFDFNSDGDLNDVGDRKRGYPIFRFWGDVNGNATDTTPIAAYRVQVGSGTGSDVAETLIGKVKAGPNAGQGANDDTQFLANCDSSGNNTDADALTTFTFPQVQEHDCRGVSDANKLDAICFYGYSRWVIQAKALETDKRNGAVFGKFKNTGDLKRPSFSSINETPSRFEGTRLVYNYVGLNSDGGGNDYPRIEDSRRFVGVSLQPDDVNTTIVECLDGIEAAVAGIVPLGQSAVDCNFDGDKVDTNVPFSGVPGFICGDLTARKIIATYGLKPLPMAATSLTIGAYGQSYCRLNKDIAAS